MLLERAQALLDAGRSVRDAAHQLDVPCSTLLDWLANRTPTGSAADVSFGSPEGVEWLHRFVIAAHFGITGSPPGKGTRGTSKRNKDTHHPPLLEPESGTQPGQYQRPYGRGR